MLQLLYLLIFLVIVNGCEQYLGYRFDVQNPDNTISIRGTVQNTFTDEKIDSALIEIGNQKTYSDEFGAYDVIHSIDTDDERNRPVSIHVSAKNYLAYSNSFIIYHEDIQHNISLDYAAPLIEKATVTNDAVTFQIICTVLMRDYQGSHDIRSVIGSFFYEKEGSHIYKQLDIPLVYSAYVSYTSAEYTCMVPRILDDGWTILSRGFFYYIYAEDKAGHFVRKRFK